MTAISAVRLWGMRISGIEFRFVLGAIVGEVRLMLGAAFSDYWPILCSFVDFGVDDCPEDVHSGLSALNEFVEAFPEDLFGDVAGCGVFAECPAAGFQGVFVWSHRVDLVEPISYQLL